jgi:hypothetical protein
MRARVGLVGGILFVVGCSDGLPPDAPTYHRDIAPLVAGNCLGCHVEEGIAHFSLDGYDAIDPIAELALGRIERGEMPPWMPDRSCRTFEDERGLETHEIDLFRRWVDHGSPEGDPDDAVEIPMVPPPTFEATDVAAMTEPYTPPGDPIDDYRCFILDLEVPADTYLTASQAVPDQQRIVHHVLAYAFPPELVALAEAADAADPEPGYVCFGAPFPMAGGGGGLAAAQMAAQFPTLVGGWAPGNIPLIYPEGSASRIVAGSRIVMQVHYNMLAGPPTPDRTEMRFRLSDARPDFLVETRPALITDIDIPAGARGHEHEATFYNYRDEPVVLGAVAGHMHLIGTEIHSEVVRADGSEDCLLRIPRWDFDWQQSYRLPADRLVTLAPGDGVHLRCVYDNSRENQPIVDGTALDPSRVMWGEGTLDEMCVLFLAQVEPFTPPPPPSAGCGGVSECMGGCDVSDADCLLACMGADVGCYACTIEQSLSCAPGCAGHLLAMRECLTTCLFSSFTFRGSAHACFEDRCAAELSDLTGCLDPLLSGGACDAGFGECGISL